MAGHSKWKNTKRRKNIQDIKRGKVFNKLIREVKTATKLGGRDVTYNSRLRVVLEKALSKNMAKGTLNRVVSHYCHKVDNNKILDDVFYEGYGPGGTALLLKCLTDNRNRVVSEIRHILSMFGGNLGTSGSVTYLFNKKGIISCSQFSEDIITNAALKIGADDVVVHLDGVIDIYISLNLLSKMEVELNSLNVKIRESTVFMEPCLYINLNEDDSLQLLKLIKMLKDIDDVYEIYHNGKIFKS